MKSDFPSRITKDAEGGLILAGRLAVQLQSQLAQGNAHVERPGGTNYSLPPFVPKEVICAVLFYAIAAANQGWPSNQ